jgi:hypothetical protein
MKVGEKKGGWLFQKTKCLLLLKGASIFELSRHFVFRNVQPYEEENYGDKCALQLYTKQILQGLYEMQNNSGVYTLHVDPWF